MRGSSGRFVLIALVGGLLAVPLGSAVDAQTVRAKWERGTDFSKYQTFAWVEGQPARAPDVDRLIRDTVENELALHGIFPDETEPDLHVAYYASAKEELEVQGGYSRDWTEAGAVTVNHYVAGTLVIDVVDVSRNRLVWSATATATITADLKRSRSRIPGVVRKMFADFPPHNARLAPPSRPWGPTPTARRSALSRCAPADGSRSARSPRYPAATPLRLRSKMRVNFRHPAESVLLGRWRIAAGRHRF